MGVAPDSSASAKSPSFQRKVCGVAGRRPSTRSVGFHVQLQAVVGQAFGSPDNTADAPSFGAEYHDLGLIQILRQRCSHVQREPGWFAVVEAFDVELAVDTFGVATKQRVEAVIKMSAVGSRVEDIGGLLDGYARLMFK